MSAPVKKCEVCDDTGSKSRDLSGDIDCVACSAADERTALNFALCGIRRTNADEIAWRAYQLGKAAASAETSTKDELIATLHRQYSELEMALAVEHAALADALRHVANLKDRLNAAPVVPVAAQPVVLRNPHTGVLRDSRDIESDPTGVLIVEPGAPLHAAPSLEAQPAGEA